MISSEHPPGIVVLCNADGFMLEILDDEGRLPAHVQPGQPITSLIDQGSLLKARNFLATLQRQGAVCDWELNVPLAGQIKLAYFSGAVIDRGFLIVSTLGRSSQQRFQEELAKINNGQEISLAEQAAQRRHLQERDSSLFDDLTRLNNELTTVQRELAKRNAELTKAHAETEVWLSAIKHILIAVNKDGQIRRWNQTAVTSFGLKKEEVIGQSIAQIPLSWDLSDILECLAKAIAQPQMVLRREIKYTALDSQTRILQLTFHPFYQTHPSLSGCLLIGHDITEIRKMENQLRHAQKLESIGQLAAGIAHEINTPTQYVGDNTRFVRDSFTDLATVLEKFGEVLTATRAGNPPPELLAEVEQEIEAADVEYLLEEIPNALQQSLDGVTRIAQIVQAMKDFAHPGSTEKKAADLNKAIASTITVARNEWKYVAEVETHFDETLPLVPVSWANSIKSFSI